MDLGETLRRQLEHGSVWLDRDTVDPHDPVIARLRNGELSPPDVAAEVLGLLASDDLRHRTGAAALLYLLTDHLDADALAALMRSRPELLRGVKPAWRIDHEDLELVVAVALARSARRAQRDAVGLLEQLALERPWRAHLLVALARLSPAFVVKHAREIMTHQDHAALEALGPSRAMRVLDLLASYRPN